MELLQDVNWSLVAPLIVLQAILMIAALVSCMKQEETNGPKWMLVLIILFVNLLGPILYFVMGRKNG